jgi:hypothetical protein
MYAMFSKTKAFNQPLEKWHIFSVKNMDAMFKDAYSFNQPLTLKKFNIGCLEL